VRRIGGDGVELAVLDEGEGVPVLLIHGFPDSADLWRHQVNVLTAAGFRAIAPDLRGFGASGKPEAVEDYRLGRSVRDMVAILDALAIERAHVVGHDWGAGVAWALASLHPQRVDRLVAMSVGHPGTRTERTLESRQRAWYTLLFQFAEAEALLSREDWKLFREWAATHPDLEARIAALSEPGALTAGLGWYRANLHPARDLDPPRDVPPVQAPTLGLWSDGDAYLTEHFMVRSADQVSGPWRYERVAGASHWMQLDAADRVNALLLEFLA
jgi:pimeloyl-ACP methyl ester carboxylesterase